MMIPIVQAIVSGLAVGSAYALIALGFSITFTTTKTLNFSHGDFVSVGAFIGVGILWLLMGKPINSPLTGVNIATWQHLAAALGSVVVIGFLGVLLYFLAVRPFAGKPGMSILNRRIRKSFSWRRAMYAGWMFGQTFQGQQPQ